MAPTKLTINQNLENFGDAKADQIPTLVPEILGHTGAKSVPAQVPDIVTKFLGYFPLASIYTTANLQHSCKPKILYSLKNCPCPHFPNHIHRNNHTYILYSPSYSPILQYLYVGCHKHSELGRVSAFNLLKHHIEYSLLRTQTLSTIARIRIRGMRK